MLEIALLADGVPPNKLYPLDLDRAFKKLDTIKSDIVWWSGGAQSQQLLASGEAPIGMFWNGRLHALAQTGVPVGISWNQNLTAADMLVIPKGAKWSVTFSSASQSRPLILRNAEVRLAHVARQADRRQNLPGLVSRAANAAVAGSGHPFFVLAAR
ncbi:hypothetical protein QFZ94_001195 [Paraburkholderia sp. JPY465]